MAKSRRKPSYLKKTPGRIGFKSSNHKARDFEEPIYVAWRKSVRTRDNNTCQMPGCKKAGKGIQIHHILPWAIYPNLRFMTFNGICLCTACHKSIRKREMDYAPLLSSIATRNEKENPQGPLKILKRRCRRKKT